MNWILISFIAAILGACSLIIISFLKNNRNIDYIVITTIIFTICAILGILLCIIQKKTILSNIRKDYKPLILAGILFFITNIACFYAISNAPNPAYANSIININAVIMLLIGIYIFKQQVTVMSEIGVVLIAIGIIIVLYFSRSDKKLELSLLDKYL